jgi:hypothetical protein
MNINTLHLLKKEPVEPWEYLLRCQSEIMRLTKVDLVILTYPIETSCKLVLCPLFY